MGSVERKVKMNLKWSKKGVGEQSISTIVLEIFKLRSGRGEETDLENLCTILWGDDGRKSANRPIWDLETTWREQMSLT
jgi:hypothetical protein